MSAPRASEFRSPFSAGRHARAWSGDLMPKSIQEILGHAEELAQRFEDYEPNLVMSAPSRNAYSNEPPSPVLE